MSSKEELSNVIEEITQMPEEEVERIWSGLKVIEVLGAGVFLVKLKDPDSKKNLSQEQIAVAMAKTGTNCVADCALKLVTDYSRKEGTLKITTGVTLVNIEKVDGSILERLQDGILQPWPSR